MFLHLPNVILCQNPKVSILIRCLWIWRLKTKGSIWLLHMRFETIILRFRVLLIRWLNYSYIVKPYLFRGKVCVQSPCKVRVRIKRATRLIGTGTDHYTTVSQRNAELLSSINVQLFAVTSKQTCLFITSSPITLSLQFHPGLCGLLPIKKPSLAAMWL